MRAMGLRGPRLTLGRVGACRARASRGWAISVITGDHKGSVGTRRAAPPVVFPGMRLGRGGGHRINVSPDGCWRCARLPEPRLPLAISSR